MEKQIIENYARQLVDAGYRIHKKLGPGLLLKSKLSILFCMFMLHS